MLAYVFWHRPRAGVASADYEARLRAFHRRLNACSASFRISALPFAEGLGYEDWYLVGSWAELGDLNGRAISGERRAPHDAVAEIAGEGWGAIYALIRGEPRPPLVTRWVSKPPGLGYEGFLASLEAPTVWQRQMLLGPAPEFCVTEKGRVATKLRVGIRTAVYPGRK